MKMKINLKFEPNGSFEISNLNVFRKYSPEIIYNLTILEIKIDLDISRLSTLEREILDLKSKISYKTLDYHKIFID